ncbi:MAG: ABC transporter substrate-binding protein, partial [Candidatus Thorarchaeota archaeon]
MRVLVVGVVILSLLVPIAYPTAAIAFQGSSPNINAGPFIDRILLEVITQEDQQVLALQDNAIDLIGNTIDPDFLIPLELAENVEVTTHLRNGFGYFIINTAKYPFNITAFRRAIAFALDKTRISEEFWNGLAVPIDSCVPYSSPFSIEGTLPYSYYDANPDQGNVLLNMAGFFDVDEDGKREAPDGSDFDVLVEASSSATIVMQICEELNDTLSLLGINATMTGPYYDLPERINNHGDFDIVFFTKGFNDFDVDWLAYEFWSEYADKPSWNLQNFRDATYDMWREQLLYSTTYDVVLEAAEQMQIVLAYECPIIVCYNELLFNAFRTDRFEGFVNDVVDGVSGRWSTYRARLVSSEGGPLGGTLRRGVPTDAYWPNFMRPFEEPGYFWHNENWESVALYMEPWSSLLIQDPTGRIIPWLAESYSIETHDDNSNVPIGHTRFVFNIHPNASWSDGTPITGNDVAFTMNFYREGPGNPLGADLTYMSAAYSLSPYQAVIEFSSESYWHLRTVANKPIIPSHIFVDIGAENWSLWNPSPVEEPLVVSGPFQYTAYLEGEWAEMSANPLHFNRP